MSPDARHKRLSTIGAELRRRTTRIDGYEEELDLARQEGRSADASAIRLGIAAARAKVEELEAEAFLIEGSLHDSQDEDAIAKHAAHERARIDDLQHWQSEARRTADPKVAAVATRKVLDYFGQRGIAATGAISPEEIQDVIEAEAAAALALSKTPAFRAALETKRASNGGTYGGL